MNSTVQIPLPRLFDKDMRPIGRLHPTKANYHLKLIPLSTGGFELVGEHVTVGQFVQLYDTFGEVGVFRVSQTDIVMGVRRQQTAKLEHAITTLGDKIIDGYFEFGGLGTTTESTLRMLLAKQSQVYWTFGECDFNYSYQYSVENEYLINAILSVATPIPGNYQWEFDTSVFPFRLSLKAAPTKPSMELRLSRNIQTVKQRVDFTKMRNRLIPKGFGEGVNQLDIRSVNGGLNYLQNDASISAFGVVEDVYPDTKITDPATLKAAGQAALDSCNLPKVTTEISGEDVFGLTGEPLDRYRIGAVARVPLVDYGISIEERVFEVKKDDIYAPNQRATLVLSNQRVDIASETAALIRKTRIAELYSQGSTCLFAISFNGNCDESNPLEVWIPIDKNAASINVLQITYKITAFRAYSKAASYSGGQARTSDAGTQATAEIPSRVFASDVVMTEAIAPNGDSMTVTGGNWQGIATETNAATGNTGSKSDYNTESSGSLTTNSGGSGSTGTSAPGTGSGGGHSHSFSDSTSVANGHQHSITSGASSTGGVNTNVTHNISISGTTGSGGSHHHSVDSHTHNVNGHTHNINGHTHVIPAHYHSLNNHKHTLSEHQHNMNHKHGLSIAFTFPRMTLRISGHSHNVVFNDHTHPIEYGIFRGTTASRVTVKLGDNAVPAAVADTMDFDAVPYMQKDSNGRIVRGWHKLTFTPDRMTGISGTAYVKTFVTAFSGGNY